MSSSTLFWYLRISRRAVCLVRAIVGYRSCVVVIVVLVVGGVVECIAVGNGIEGGEMVVYVGSFFAWVVLGSYQRGYGWGVECRK